MTRQRVPEKRVMSFKVTDDVKAWLEQRAAAGYRSVSAQVLLLVEQAMRAETQEARQ